MQSDWVHTSFCCGSPPGAARSTPAPRWLYDASAPERPVAATMSASPPYESVTGRLLLPAENTTTAPAIAASCTAVGIADDCDRPGTSGPSERLRICAPCATAQWMPAATSSGWPTQLPELSSKVRTRTGRIRALGATPKDDAATV